MTTESVKTVNYSKKPSTGKKKSPVPVTSGGIKSFFSLNKVLTSG